MAGMPTTAPAPAERDPALLRRWSALLAFAVLLWPMLAWTEFTPSTLFDARSLQAAGRFVGDFLPPRHDAAFLAELARETWRTVAIATAGMALAWLVAVPLALAATSRLSRGAVAGRMGRLPAAARQAVKWLLVVLRSIPELVWALVFVRVVGLGPTAGVLAIAIAYGGMLGKVYAEILESGDAAPSQALLRNGASRLQALLFGLLPACGRELASYTVYRWECAVRSSVVLGFVGAGGLGQMLDSAAKLFAGAEIGAILLVFVGLVALSDRASALLRRSMSGGDGAAPPQVWRRPGLWTLAAVAGLAAASFETLALRWADFFAPGELARMARFGASFFPPEASPAFLRKVLDGAAETLAMSLLGTLLAAAAGLGLALPASARGGAAARSAHAAARLLLNGLRAVPELVWASLLLVAAGLGPFPGTLALALHTTGVLGRLFAESLENADPGPALTLRVRGVPPGRVFLWATLPQALPQLLSYSLYRWENNIRAAAVLGVVGAGGLGQMLHYHLGLFQMRETCTVLLATLGLVAAVDALSFEARRRMNR